MYLTLNSQFKPFTYDELVKPLQDYGEAYREVEKQYNDLAQQTEAWKNIATQENSPEAYAMYKKYADELNAVVSDFSKGMTIQNRGKLSSLKSRYASEITPISNAYTALTKANAFRDEMRAKDDSVIFNVDRYTSLDDFLNGQLADNSFISGRTLQADIASQTLTNSYNKYNELVAAGHNKKAAAKMVAQGDWIDEDSMLSGIYDNAGITTEEAAAKIRNYTDNGIAQGITAFSTNIEQTFLQEQAARAARRGGGGGGGTAVPTITSIKALYKKANGKEMTDEEITKLFTYEDLNGFIQAFLQVQALYQSVEDFDYIFNDLACYLVENGIVYTEAFFAPTSFLKRGFKYDEMVAIFDRKIAEIKEKHGITVKLLMDVSRTFGCENAMNNYNLLKQFPSENIIGIGLGGAESKGPAKDYAPVYEQAIKDGFKVVAHAGEDVGPESIWDAINLCHVTRVGHCITAIQDEKLMDTLKERNIVLEVCPTSNVFTKKYVKCIKEHPVSEFFKRGLFVTLNTDDPVFFKVSLLDEYWKLVDEAGWSMDDIKTLVKNGFKALFADDAVKSEWCAKVDNSF